MTHQQTQEVTARLKIGDRLAYRGILVIVMTSTLALLTKDRLYSVGKQE